MFTGPYPCRLIIPTAYNERFRSGRHKSAKNRNLCGFGLGTGVGWQLVKDIMQAADIPEGPHQTAKGLRHAYGIHAISKGIPVTSVQKWLGHAQLSTTAIYVDFVGAEASDLAARMWE